MFGDFAMRTFVGMIVALPIYLFLSPTHGVGGMDPITALMMMIICTAGTALLVIIPACYLVGLFFTIWFIPFGMSDAHSADSVSQKPRKACPPRSQAALEEYILSEIKRERVWAEIRKQCASAGWPEEVINKAFDSAKSRILLGRQ